MKIRMFGIGLLALVASLFANGCATSGHSKNFQNNDTLADNSLLIQNSSPYAVDVQMDGKPWLNGIRGRADFPPLPVHVLPRCQYLAVDCSLSNKEEILLEFKASREVWVGNKLVYEPVGTYFAFAGTGIYASGKSLVLHRSDFK